MDGVRARLDHRLDPSARVRRVAGQRHRAHEVVRQQSGRRLRLLELAAGVASAHVLDQRRRDSRPARRSPAPSAGTRRRSIAPTPSPRPRRRRSPRRRTRPRAGVAGPPSRRPDRRARAPTRAPRGTAPRAGSRRRRPRPPAPACAGRSPRCRSGCPAAPGTAGARRAAERRYPRRSRARPTTARGSRAIDARREASELGFMPERQQRPVAGADPQGHPAAGDLVDGGRGGGGDRRVTRERVRHRGAEQQPRRRRGRQRQVGVGVPRVQRGVRQPQVVEAQRRRSARPSASNSGGG